MPAGFLRIEIGWQIYGICFAPTQSPYLCRRPTYLRRHLPRLHSFSCPWNVGRGNIHVGGTIVERSQPRTLMKYFWRGRTQRYVQKQKHLFRRSRNKFWHYAVIGTYNSHVFSPVELSYKMPIYRVKRKLILNLLYICCPCIYLTFTGIWREMGKWRIV